MNNAFKAILVLGFLGLLAWLCHELHESNRLMGESVDNERSKLKLAKRQQADNRLRLWSDVGLKWAYLIAWVIFRIRTAH